jgi:tripartite-type tricarboxylate transporter receptor subunit TctC
METRSFSQRVYVENRPGVNGIIGSEAVARSVPDGHTLPVPVWAQTTLGGTP